MELIQVIRKTIERVKAWTNENFPQKDEVEKIKLAKSLPVFIVGGYQEPVTLYDLATIEYTPEGESIIGAFAYYEEKLLELLPINVERYWDKSKLEMITPSLSKTDQVIYLDGVLSLSHVKGSEMQDENMLIWSAITMKFGYTDSIEFSFAYPYDNGTTSVAYRVKYNNYVGEYNILGDGAFNHYTEKIDQVSVDQEYNPESENAQSGKAVAMALEDAIGDIDNALDGIIDIQNTLIGGESE